MGHISDRGGDTRLRWRARWRLPDGRERSKCFRLKADAEAHLAAQAVAAGRGESVDPMAGRVTFGEWWATWQRSRTAAPSTRARDDSLARNHLLPSLGARPLASIHQPDVVAFVAEVRGKGLAPSTVTRTYQLLAMGLQAAVDAGRIARSPCRNVELPRIDRRDMRFLSPAELDRLAGAITPRYRALVLVLGLGGLRIAEAAGLTDTSVLHATRQLSIVETAVWTNGELHLRPPKTRAGRRRVTLPGAAWEALTDHLDERGNGDQGQVFPAPKGGYLRARHFRRRDFAKAAQDAELDGLRPHDLRHTAVSLWIAAGADPKAVSARAGHSSVAFTFDQYGHLWPEADAAVAGLVDDLYGAQVAEAKRAREGPAGPGDHRGSSV